MTPDEVHEMGLRQVAEISAEIDSILDSQGMTEGSVGERLAALGRDPRHIYPNTAEGRAELLADLNQQIERVTDILPRYFSTLPQAAVEVRRVPELTEAGAPGGYYMSPALDGSRPGAYYINLRDTAEWPRWTLPTLTYHEANPGHHWQIALGQESTRIPVLRQIMGYSAFTEGQATSYKVGHTRIAQLRERARARLGDAFDIRSFHDTVLLSGAMPLNALDRLVDDWVEAQLSGAARTAQ